MEKKSGASTLVPILGLLQITSEKDVQPVHDDGSNNEIPADENDEKNYIKKQTSTMPGRLVVYGDSNCIDDSHLQQCMYCKILIL